MALHYLIDGYNVLYALPDLPPGSWEKKREQLLLLLIAKKPHGKNQITVVFDSREGSGDRMRVGEIAVAFTSGETADDWISHYVRQAENPRVCVVVTNDQGLRRLIRGTGAKGCSVEEFFTAKNKNAQDKPSANNPPQNADDITDEFRKKWL